MDDRPVIEVFEAFAKLQKVLDKVELDHVINVLGVLQNDIGTEGLNKLCGLGLPGVRDRFGQWPRGEMKRTFGEVTA